MSIEFDIACLRAPHDINDKFDMMQLIGRARMAADQLEELNKRAEAAEEERDKLLEHIKWVTAVQKKNYGHATDLHIDMLDWPKMIEGLQKKDEEK